MLASVRGANFRGTSRLIWLAGFLGAALGFGALVERNQLFGHIQAGLAMTPVVADTDVLLLGIRVALVGTLLVVILSVSRWAPAVRGELERAQASGGVDPNVHGWAILVAAAGTPPAQRTLVGRHGSGRA